MNKFALRGFTAESQAYARGRPEYPSDILPWLTEDLNINENRSVVDLGAGTGKFTTLLLETGADVIAVEPIEAMRTQLSKRFPDVLSVDGCAEAIPLDTSSVDAMICAQAFHWFATEAALGEIHRVLKPGGSLGLVWNVRDESVDWVSAITEIITPYEGDAPRFYKGDWHQPFAGGRYFSALKQTSFPYQHIGTAQEVIIDRILSVSFIAVLQAQEKAKVTDQLHSLIASHSELRKLDKIVFPYRTEAYHCISLDKSP